MTLRSRLVVGLVIIAIILVTPLALAIQSLKGLGKDPAFPRDRDFAASLLLARLREGLNDVRRQELALLFPHDSESHDNIERGIRHVQAMSDSMSHYALPNIAKTIGVSVDKLSKAVDQEFAAALAARPDSADTLSGRLFVPAVNV